MGRLVGVDQMQLVHRALVRIAWIGPANARRIGGHAADLLAHLIGGVAQGNGIAVGLGHLLAVQTGHLRGRRQQRLGLGQDHLATAFEVAEQAFFITQGDVLLFLQ